MQQWSEYREQTQADKADRIQAETKVKTHKLARHRKQLNKECVRACTQKQHRQSGKESECGQGLNKWGNNTQVKQISQCK